MARNNKRTLVEGIGFGLIAGVIYLAAEMTDAAARGASPLAPLRWAASVVMGFHALDSYLGTTYLAGLTVHLALSALLGLGYGQIEARLPPYERRLRGVELGIGAVYGAGIWFVTVEMIASRLYPWFADLPPLGSLLLMTLFFGAPLGVMFAATERRMRLVVHPSVG
jgi:hypothetical protein